MTVPPHSTEAEQGVLGCILLQPDPCLEQCMEVAQDREHLFYERRHNLIYNALLSLHREQSVPDIITTQQRLKDLKFLEAIGGYEYLSNLPNLTPSPFNLKYYLDILIEKWTLRQVVKVCHTTIAEVMETQDLRQFMDQFESGVMAISRTSQRKSTQVIADLVDESIQEMDKAIALGGALPGIPTGFPILDDMLGGLISADMIVIAARPSCGKTSFAINVADHVAGNLRIPTGIISLEMRASQLTNRMLSAGARVDSMKMRRGTVNQEEQGRIVKASVRLRKSPIYIDDQPGIDTMVLRAKVRRMIRDYGIKFLVIDYLQLLTSSTHSENLTSNVTQVSSDVHTIAREFNLPVLIAAQLNREMEKDKNRPPVLSDLRQSGAIEQDADTVMFLWQPNPDQDRFDERKVQLLIRKQRNGPLGNIDFKFELPFTKFSPWTPIWGSDVPSRAPAPRSHSVAIDHSLPPENDSIQAFKKVL